MKPGENSLCLICIQNFINSLDENSIPKAMLKRIRSGYSNTRIIEDFRAMMLKVKIVYHQNQVFFLVPYCTLALNIGIAHGLGLYQVLYPKSGYFANPENTLDNTYTQYVTKSYPTKFDPVRKPYSITY